MMQYVLSEEEFQEYVVLKEQKPETRQTFLLGHSQRVGNVELFNRITWLNKHNIELNDWQIVRFTGFDRGVGKTYTSFLLNAYLETSDAYLDPDAHRDSHATSDYMRTLKDFKEQLKT